MVLDACKKSRDWKSSVAVVAAESFAAPLTGALSVTMTFCLPRPKNHYGTGKSAGRLRMSAPRHPSIRPDVLKLARSTEDALTGIAWRDDSQIVREYLIKRYADRIAGTMIEIHSLKTELIVGLPFESALNPSRYEEGNTNVKKI